MRDAGSNAGLRVRKAREKLNLSQAELAEMVDLSPGHIGQIERGGRGFSLDAIRRIAKSLGIPLEEIIAQEELRESRTAYDTDLKWRQLRALTVDMDEEILDLFLLILRLFKKQEKKLSKSQRKTKGQ